MSKYGLVVDTMMQYFPNESYVLEKLGMKSIDDLYTAMTLMEPFTVLKMATSLFGQLPNINPLIDSITQEGTEEIISEIYMQGSFEKSVYMAEGKSHRPVTRAISIPVDSYDYAVEFDYGALICRAVA